MAGAAKWKPERLPEYFEVQIHGERYWAVPLAAHQCVSPLLLRCLQEHDLGALLQRRADDHGVRVEDAPDAERLLVVVASMTVTEAIGPSGQAALCFGLIVTVWVTPTGTTACSRADLVKPHAAA